MKHFLLILLFLPVSLNASERLLDIEKKAAELSSCSIKQPCVITVDNTKDFYIVKVKRSTTITEYGVLKYKSGSTTYHKFDKNGVYFESKHTT